MAAAAAASAAAAAAACAGVDGAGAAAVGTGAGLDTTATEAGAAAAGGPSQAALARPRLCDTARRARAHRRRAATAALRRLEQLVEQLLRRAIDGGLALSVGEVGVSASDDQGLGELGVPVGDGHVQRSAAVLVARVRVGTEGQQAVRRDQVARGGSQVQQGAALGVLRLDIELSLLVDQRGRRGVLVRAVREDVVEL
eukprot:scaffold30156_cov65-Phaeocystis_antarctica.AAC.11